MIKKELTIAPTYVGHNDGCVFVVPAKIFQMKLQGTVDPEDTKTFAQYINKTFTGFEKARKSKYNNEGKTEIESTPEFWEEFERVAKDLGVDLVGYTPVDENFVFKDLQVFGKNGIILAMELQWDQIKTAPGYKCGMEAFRVYQALGDIVLKMTAYLQERGYKAEAHVPFGGKLLYGPHAVAAGLGVVGWLGLILTPEFGPRQRFGMITTDADIPLDHPARDLDKVNNACDKCSACALNCPAALPEPVEQVPASGIITRIDRTACEDQIVDHNYCSVCLKVCPPGRPKKG